MFNKRIFAEGIIYKHLFYNIVYESIKMITYWATVAHVNDAVHEPSVFVDFNTSDCS